MPPPRADSVRRQVLFVDDEVRILRGLRRMLSAHRDRWDMQFAENAEDALEHMAAHPFDVVVSDIRMPGTDGVMLLSEVRNRHPGCVRIVLSGHAEYEAAVRAASVAHQFLIKPCTGPELMLVLERSVRLHTRLRDDNVRARIGAVSALPSPPQLFLEVEKAVEDPGMGTRDIGAMIERDPAMCAKILQLVNSAFFGSPQRVSDITTAVNILGLKLLRNVVLAAEVFRTFDGGQNLESLQKRSWLAARIARDLLTDRRDREDAFAAGLLHAVGCLLLMHAAPELYKKVCDERPSSAVEREELEREHIGATTSEAGAYLLSMWGIPDIVVEAVRFHRQPKLICSDVFDVVGAAHVGIAVADAKTDGVTEALIDEDYVESVGAGLAVEEAWRIANE